MLRKTFVVDQRFWFGMLSQDGVLVNHPTMGRAMKPKQQFLTALLSCGRAQIQASGWKLEVVDNDHYKAKQMVGGYE